MWEDWNETGAGLRVARRRRWRTTAGDGEGDGDATAPPLRSLQAFRLIRFSRLAAPTMGWALVGHHRKMSGPLAQIDGKLCPRC